MDEKIIDRIWHEELEKWGMKDKGWTWRHGYPIIFDYFHAKSYASASKIITIPNDIKTTREIRINLRHEIYHAFCYENNLKHSDFLSFMAEIFPLEKILLRKLKH